MNICLCQVKMFFMRSLRYECMLLLWYEPMINGGLRVLNTMIIRDEGALKLFKLSIYYGFHVKYRVLRGLGEK